MKRFYSFMFVIFSFAISPLAMAESLSANVHLLKDTGDGLGAPIGKITFTDTKNGLQINTEISGLTAGEHGFHIHANNSCAPAEKDGKMVAGLGAGGHFDPHNTGKHLGPEMAGGHLGDLPALVVAADGKAYVKLMAKNLTVKELKNHALIIHANGDNYSDMPVTLGGGGSRVACALLQ